MSLVLSAKAQSRPYKGIGMEGLLARWYARNTKGSLADFRDLAKRIAAQLRPDALVLEVAPGPGFLAIEIARLGPYRVSGVDISKTLVEIAQRNAAEARVDVEFRVGNASALPFPANWFDFLVNRAAFKNFGDPVGALNEMHRVLRPGGTALIIDMRKDATAADIALEVSKMNLGGLSAAITRLVLRWLRGRAYSRAEFEAMIARTPFGTAKIDEQLIGFEITLTKST